MKSLLFVLVALPMFFFGSSSVTATPTTKGFADTYLFEDFDVGLSPVVSNATVNAASNYTISFGTFVVTDYPEASSKARLCTDAVNIYNPVPVAILNAESTANALRAERLCKGEGKYKRDNTTDSTKYRTLSSSAYWHGGDSKASR